MYSVIGWTLAGLVDESRLAVVSNTTAMRIQIYSSISLPSTVIFWRSGGVLIGFSVFGHALMLYA